MNCLLRYIWPLLLNIIKDLSHLLLERQFQMNILRLSGNTQMVTLETMFETITYASQQGIIEILFLEEYYLPYFFDDKLLQVIQLYVCAIPSLIQRYNEAKQRNDKSVLEAFRNTHRKARMFLDNQDIKMKLKAFSLSRSSVIQYQAYINMINVMLNYTYDYVNHTPAIDIIHRVLPQFAANIPHTDA